MSSTTLSPRLSYLDDLGVSDNLDMSEISDNAKIKLAWKEDSNVDNIECTGASACTFKSMDENPKLTSSSLFAPLTSWRRAEHTDLPIIQGMCNDQSQEIYGNYDLEELVESSLMPIVVLNFNGEVVAFMSVQDYPHVPFLPRSDWEQWLDEMYQVRIYTALNTRFIHLLVWNESYEDLVLNSLLSPIFAEDAYVEYVLLILPNGQEIKGPYKECFFHYLAIMDLENEKRSVRLLREDKEPHLLGLFVAPRVFIGPNVAIRKAKPEDNDPIIDELLNIYPGVNLVFGKKFFKNLLKQCNNKNKKRKVIVGQYLNTATYKGLMTYCTKVNAKHIEENYDTFLYQDFKLLSTFDDWYEKFKTWNKVDRENPLKKFDKTVKNEFTIGSFEEKPSETSVPKTVEEEDDYVDDIDETEDLSEINKGITVTEKKKVESAPEQQTDNNYYHDFERRTQICMSYANEESILKGRPHYNKRPGICKDTPGQNIKDKKVPEKILSTCMEIEYYAPGRHQEPRLVHNYLKYIFEHAPPKKMFILVAVGNHDHNVPLLHYFQRLERKRRTYENRDLYVCFKLSITGQFLVREAEMGDFEEIIAITLRNPHYQTIQKDVFHILRHKSFLYSKGSVPQKCFVLICCEILIGFAVVGPEDEVDYLVGNYNLEDFIYYSKHRRDAHGYMRHMVITPSFLHLTTYFLRSIMRSCFWTSMYAFLVPGYLMAQYPEFSILSGLEYWVPVQPRQLPQYPKEGLGCITPHGRLIIENMRPFALYHMNYKMSGIQKKLNTYKIVVVGGGELALSFLEHLIFSPTCWYMGYSNITLIAPEGLPNRFEEYGKIIKTMMVKSDKYDADYLDRLSLPTWVDVVEGMVTSIDRKRKFLLVDEMEDIDYDYLFLFCGTQFEKPHLDSEPIPSKECKVLLDEIKGIEEYYSNIPINLFLINTDKDAYHAILGVNEILDKRTYEVDSKIVVYGHCLNALACIAGLLELGINPTLIVFVQPRASPCDTIDYIFCTEVYNSIRSSLEGCLIKAHYNYSFSCYETLGNIQDGTVITYVHFKSDNHLLSLPTLALFSFEPKKVNYETRLALQKACLVFDDKLVIDSNFLTNDKNIYAAGSLTRYKRKYYCDHYNHEHFNAHEIGAEIAYRFQKRIKNEEGGHNYFSTQRTVTEFSNPIVVSCQMPGGWNYLHITKPGLMFPIQTILSNKKPWGKILTTGNAFDKEGPGYFRIIINQSGLVCDILCFSRRDIDIRNLTSLYNKHESLLNKLILRFDGELIPDFFSYFREPWAYALYHDRFSLFLEEIQALYLKKIEDENVSFYEAVAYSFNSCKWRKVSGKDKTLLEDLFNFVPWLKERIEKKFLDYLEYNENHLTTYLTQSRRDTGQEEYGTSRLLEPEEMQRGVLPLVPTQPEYIVPTPGNRKEIEERVMERPMEEMISKGQRKVYKSDDDKKSVCTSVTSTSEPEESSTSSYKMDLICDEEELLPEGEEWKFDELMMLKGEKQTLEEEEEEEEGEEVLRSEEEKTKVEDESKLDEEAMNREPILEEEESNYQIGL